MSSRLALLLPLLLCALWPQGVVLCSAADGHSEFEPGCAPRCPADEGEGEDCSDLGLPDLAATHPAPTPRPPALAGAASGCPDRPSAASPAPAVPATCAGPPPELLRTVILLV